MLINLPYYLLISGSGVRASQGPPGKSRRFDDMRGAFLIFANQPLVWLFISYGIMLIIISVIYVARQDQKDQNSRGEAQHDEEKYLPDYCFNLCRDFLVFTA